MEVFHLERNTRDTYICRIYERPWVPRYKWGCPVSYRGNGEFEAHMWLSFRKLWPEAPVDLPCKTMRFIKARLEAVDPRFLHLTGTFEIARIRMYERMFRKCFDLKRVRYTAKAYNDVLVRAWVVYFEEQHGG